MRNIKSLVKDEDGGAILSVCLGGMCSCVGCCEWILTDVLAIFAPACSSAIGAGFRDVLSFVSTWLANCLTA